MALKILQLQQDGRSDCLCSQRADELQARGERSAGGEDVVDEQHSNSGGQLVACFDCRRTVFEVVVNPRSGDRQFAGFAQRHKARARQGGCDTGEDESARLDSCYNIELSGKRLNHEFGRPAQRPGISQQRRNVLELDALGRVVRNDANKRAQAGKIISHAP